MPNPAASLSYPRLHELFRPTPLKQPMDPDGFAAFGVHSFLGLSRDSYLASFDRPLFFRLSAYFSVSYSRYRKSPRLLGPGRVRAKTAISPVHDAHSRSPKTVVRKTKSP